MGVSRGRLLGFVAGLRVPTTGSDGDLLDRYACAGDEAAFAGIVRRHGAMVLGVCRRRLGRGSDAEDAFQATFLALAWKARALDRSGSLAGWLYRAAHLAALKAARRRARHPAGAALPADVPAPDPPPAACEGRELRGILDAELAALPDKFRAVAALCLVEGRTNAEAAGVLGVPVGTVDSRLSTARKKLQGRLSRRGVAPAAAIVLEQPLAAPLTAADGVGLQELIGVTVRAVLAEAAGPGAGAVSPAVTHLARGVATMVSSKLRLAGALALALGAAGIGAGAYVAGAAAPPAAFALPAAPPLAAPARATAERGPLEAPPVGGRAAAEARGGEIVATLQQAIEFDEGHLNDIPLSELLHKLSKRYDLPFVLADGPFQAEQVNDIWERKPGVVVTQLRGLTVDQFLTAVLGSMNATHLVKNGRVEVVPVRAAARAHGGEVAEGGGTVALALPLVSVQVADVPLAEAAALVARRYDLTVVVSPHAYETKQATDRVTATLLNVPADRALELLAVQRDLEVVRDGPTFLLTTRANAAEVYKAQLARERHRHELERLRPAAAKPHTTP